MKEGNDMNEAGSLSDDNGNCHEDELRNSSSSSVVSSSSNSIGVLDLAACRQVYN